MLTLSLLGGSTAAAASTISAGLFASNSLADIITKSYAWLAPFLGQVMGTALGGYVQAVSPF
jgi:hypothetical protein